MDQFRKTKHVAKSDPKIAVAVEDAMLYAPRVYSFEVVADANNGIVSLRGTVDNLRAKRAAEQDARNTVGVISVQNRIKVRPSTPTDKEIAQNIRDAFLRDPVVDRYEIDVIVIDGEVWLTGVVDSYFEKGESDDIASTVYGVTDINNNLVVDYTDPLVYGPYVYDYDPYLYDGYGYEPGYTHDNDATVHSRIKDELWWSPFVDREDVTVVVDEGVATPSGTVDS